MLRVPRVPLLLVGLALLLGGCSEVAPTVERSGVILARDVPANLRAVAQAIVDALP